MEPHEIMAVANKVYAEIDNLHDVQTIKDAAKSMARCVFYLAKILDAQKKVDDGPAAPGS